MSLPGRDCLRVSSLTVSPHTESAVLNTTGTGGDAAATGDRRHSPAAQHQHSHQATTRSLSTERRSMVLQHTCGDVSIEVNIRNVTFGAHAHGCQSDSMHNTHDCQDDFT